MNDAGIQHETALAYRLMSQISATINQQCASPATALLALAKLLGQTVVMVDPAKPAELLDCACHVARDEMRLRATAQALQAAGLGAIMPVTRA